MTVSLPGIRLFQGTLLPGFLAIGITDAFAVTECMFIIKQQGLVDVVYLVTDLGRKFGSQHTGKRQTCLVGDNVRMSDTGNSRFTGTGSKTVCPPVRPCATDSLYLIGIVRLYIFDKLAGNCRAEFGPFVFLIPLHQHLATLCRRGRIIGKITGVLGGNDIVRIVPGFHFTQIIQDAFFELLEVIGVDTEEVSLVVMFGTISQHLFFRKETATRIRSVCRNISGHDDRVFPY